MDREDLEEYVEWASETIEEKPQMNETNTREILIREFIEVLDWSFCSLDIDGEYPVRMASRQTKVDYALMLEETPVVFVEAKGLDTMLDEDHREQITSYMHNEESVRWGLLTNAQEYEFFMYDDSPSGFSLGAFELEELPENFDVVRTLSKESVEAGESAEKAERLRELRRAIYSLRENKDEIANDITEIVTEHVGESMASVMSVAETEAKEFVNNTAEELEKRGTEGGNDDRDSGNKGGDEIACRLSRDEIDNNKNATVAVFPSEPSGIDFLKENNAWGFVRMGKEPSYLGVYISGSDQEIKYFAEVDEIVPADEADLSRPPESYNKFDANKKVVKFKENSLYELENPIPYGEYAPMGLIYTTLRKFKRAERTEDIQ